MSDRSIFLAALDIADPAARSAYLDEACAAEPDLRSQVEQLLAAHGEASGFMLRPAPALLATLDETIAERPGSFIGHYKLLEKIGEGGFGVVFMAEQQEPVRRKVALKVLKPGMDTRQVVARFEAERQALALMDHPHIAHVFDGGTTSAGRPYFVMELVRGTPITEFCDQNCLTIGQRLELFVDVCQAVQHAHQKGIIHRDLKPTNVMVTLHDGRPVAKVIDFGVAKAMGQQLTDKTLFTHFQQMVGTPLYMSPEQAEMSGLDIDTRSDIYSLGVLLYELLTGTTPFERQRLSKVGYDEMRRIIREEEPPKPSTRISTVGKLATTASQQRQSDPRKLSRLFRGELDWIVMKALEKDRDRRYETANGLAADVRRYLNDEPVRACPPSAVYRFRKFARRRKTTLVMVACVLLSLAGVAGGVGWAVRDKAAREDAIKLDQLAREKALNQVVDRNLDQAGALVEDGKWPEALSILERTEQLLASAALTERPARLMELNQAVTIAQRLEGIYQGARQGVQRRPVASRADGTIDTSNGSMLTPQDLYDDAFFLGRRQDADFAEVFRDLGIDVETLSPVEAASKIRAHGIRRELIRALDAWVVFRCRSRGIADPLWKTLVEIAIQADGDEWRNRCRDAVLKRDLQALGELADAVPIRQTPPESLYLIGEALRESGAVGKAIALLERARHQYPGDVWLNDALAFSCRSCQPPRWDAVLRYYTTVLALRPDFSPVHLAVADALKATGATGEALLEYSKAIELEPRIAVVWTNRGDLYQALRRYDEAIADYSKAIELEPNNASAWQARSSAFLAAGRKESALADATTAVGLLRRRIDQYKASPEKPGSNQEYSLAVALRSLSQLTKALGETRETENLHRDAHAIWRALVSAEPSSVSARDGLGHSYRFLAVDASDAGNIEEAIELFTQAADVFRKLWDDDPGVPTNAHFLADCHRLIGSLLVFRKRLIEAEKAHRLSVEVHQDRMARFPDQPINWTEMAESYGNLATLLEATGRRSEGHDVLRKFVEVSDKRPFDAEALFYRGVYHNRLGEHEQALADFSKSIELRPDYWEARRNRRETYLVLDQVEKALADCARLRANPQDPDARWFAADTLDVLARRLNELGRTEEAEKHYREAQAVWEELVAEFNQEDRRVRLAWTDQALGELADAAGRLDDAAAAYRQAAEVWQKLAEDFPPNSQYGDNYTHGLVALASVYAKQGRDEEAEQVLTKGIGSPPPDDPRWLVVRGRALDAIGRAEEARAMFAQAFALAPNDLMIRVQALPEISQTDAFAQRLSEVRAFMESHPQQPLAARLALAQRELQWGDHRGHAGQLQAAAETYAHAAAGFEKVIAELVANADATTTAGVPATAKDLAWYRHELGYVLVCRGEVLLHLGELSEAETALRRGLEVHESLAGDANAPADTPSRLAWSRAAVARLHGELAARLAKEGAADQAKGKFREAVAAYNKALELAPDNALTHNNLAWLYATCPDAELRDPAKAVELAKKAVELSPKEPSGWNTLGVAHYRAGDWSAAIEALTRSMELHEGGDAFDWFFLAMAHARLGQADEARRWHEQAVEWVQKNEQTLSGNPQWADELRRFGAEAEEVLRGTRGEGRGVRRE